ncbi:MAG: sensor histidine kinase [Alkalispirochaeta sp.]
MCRWRLVLFLVVIAVHVVAPLMLPPGRVPEVAGQWIGYAVPALGVSALLSAVFLFSLPQTFYVVTFLIQWLLLYVVGLPLGDWIGLELVLSVALIVQFAVTVDPYASSVVAVGAIVFMAVQQGSASAWSVSLLPVPTGDVVGYMLVNLAALAMAVTVHVLFERLRSVRTVSGEKDSVIRRLVDANMEYQRFALEVEKTTLQAERERISREIHDTVGYAFTNQRMMLEASTVLFERDHKRLKELILHAQESLTEGYQHVRSALRALRNVGVAMPGLNSRIHQLTQQFSRVSGVEVRYEAGGFSGTGIPDLDQALFRSVQEGITNAFCHGAAQKVMITLVRRDGAVHLRVLDDGRGSEEVQEGIGITGMRERLGPFGGKVNYRNLSPGFVLEVDVPQEIPQEVPR